MRVTGILLGVLCAGGAGWELRSAGAPDAFEGVWRDSANPYRWCDLGEALAKGNDIPKARYCYRRARELSRNVPEIWLREAKFQFQLGEGEEAGLLAAKVLRTVPDYDAVVFNYFDKFSLLRQIGDDRRATRGYIEHLIAAHDMDAATLAWHHASAKGFNDDRLTASYIDALAATHRYAQAQHAWAEYLGQKRGEYPDRNLLFNGGFELEPTSAAFDWRIEASPEFETMRDNKVSHDGQWSLRVSFRGATNVSYGNVVQLTRVTPGRHELRAWVRTDRITTNEGPRLEVFDSESPDRLDVRTDSFLGSQDWTLVSLPFEVRPGTNIVGVRIVRDKSGKYDSKIDGSCWVDTLRLARIS